MATRPRRATRPHGAPAFKVIRGRGGRPSAPVRVALVPAAVVLMLAVFAVAALQAYLAQEGFRAARLEQSLRREQERFALLRAQAAELSSPARLEDEAKRLGMTEPADPRYLRAPAAPADSSDTGPDPRTPYDAKRLLSEVP